MMPKPMTLDLVHVNERCGLVVCPACDEGTLPVNKGNTSTSESCFCDVCGAGFTTSPMPDSAAAQVFRMGR